MFWRVLTSLYFCLLLYFFALCQAKIVGLKAFSKYRIQVLRQELTSDFDMFCS